MLMALVGAVVVGTRRSFIWTTTMMNNQCRLRLRLRRRRLRLRQLRRLLCRFLLAQVCNTLGNIPMHVFLYFQPALALRESGRVQSAEH
jgi:type II secretory pathway component PulF